MNNFHRVLQKEVIAIPISDHSIVLCVFKSGVLKLPVRTLETRFSETNYNKGEFRDDLTLKLAGGGGGDSLNLPLGFFSLKFLLLDQLPNAFAQLFLHNEDIF